MKSTQTYKITRRRTGRTEINVPHRDSNINFVYQKFGPNTYANVKEAIEKDGLSAPTMTESASLLYEAFVKDNEGKELEFNDVKGTMKNRWLWGFTGNLYVPGKGAYIHDNPQVINGMPYMEESELVKKLEQNDSSVRFVSFGFKTGEMSSLELSKNLYIINLAGEEGAEKLAEVSDKHKNKKPYLWSFESVKKPLTRVSALYSGFFGRRLCVVGFSRGGDRYGYAFGVVAKNFSSGNKSLEQEIGEQ